MRPSADHALGHFDSAPGTTTADSDTPVARAAITTPRPCSISAIRSPSGEMTGDENRPSVVRRDTPAVFAASSSSQMSNVLFAGSSRSSAARFRSRVSDMPYCSAGSAPIALVNLPDRSYHVSREGARGVPPHKLATPFWDTENEKVIGVP